MNCFKALEEYYGGTIVEDIKARLGALSKCVDELCKIHKSYRYAQFATICDALDELAFSLEDDQCPCAQELIDLAGESIRKHEAAPWGATKEVK